MYAVTSSESKGLIFSQSTHLTPYSVDASSENSKRVEMSRLFLFFFRVDLFCILILMAFDQ